MRHQFFFILSGKATLEIDGSRQVLSQHEGVEVPPNVPHQMLNQSDAYAIWNFWSVPSLPVIATRF
ncbi:cupin domain-containing protein [Nostoc sp. CHAB 5824]|nr:cupin domain-containing protein [Nostoc sp. CHAB 5824]